MIVFYSQSCESCTGNHALTKMESYCRKQGVDFEQRRTILWDMYEKEASKILELNPGLKLPFFYSTNTGGVLEGFSLTPLDELQELIDRDKENETE